MNLVRRRCTASHSSSRSQAMGVEESPEESSVAKESLPKGGEKEKGVGEYEGISPKGGDGGGLTGLFTTNVYLVAVEFPKGGKERLLLLNFYFYF